MVLMIVGCNKQIPLNHEQIIQKYKTTLPLDKDFIENYKLDKIIMNLNIVIKNAENEIDNESLCELIKKSHSIEDLKNAFTTHGYNNGDSIVNYFVLKATALANIKHKFPYLSNLQKNEFNNLWIYSRRNTAFNARETLNFQFLSNNPCVDAYVDDIDDCDMEFAIETAFAIFAGGLFGIGGSPSEGIKTMVTGIGTAYVLHKRCSQTAARAYKKCMGYK